jgi:HprK-related kinase A
MQLTPLGEIPVASVERCLRGDGLSLQVSDFRCLIRSDTGLLAQALNHLYRDFPAGAEPHGFYDFRITLKRTQSPFWSKPEVAFDWEGNSPFPALPVAHTHPLFEWGLNWCIATLSGQNTVIHSAVVERKGAALILPGQPGAGKSTLCAALALKDWRLLSDELTIISRDTGRVQAIPRPISLKAESIDLIRSRCPGADLSTPVRDTHKGAIAYARPPQSAVRASTQDAAIGFVVFPRFVAGAALTVEPVARAVALTELLDQTFNVGLLGREGFESLVGAMANAQCYAVEYGDLTDITDWIDRACQ